MKNANLFSLTKQKLPQNNQSQRPNRTVKNPQKRSKFRKTKGFQKEQCGMMQHNHRGRVGQKPVDAEVAHVGFVEFVKFATHGNHLQNGGSCKRNHQSCRHVQAHRARKKIHKKAQKKRRNQQRPTRCIERQHHQRQNVDKWRDYARQLHVIDDQNLQKQKDQKTGDISDENWVHFGLIWRVVLKQIIEFVTHQISDHVNVVYGVKISVYVDV